MANDKEPAWAEITFRQNIDDMIKYGPTCPIGIGGPESDDVAMTVFAQIDTGAAGTGISPRLVDRLGLAPVSSGMIHEAGREPISVNMYGVSLFFPRFKVVLDVSGLPSLAAPHDIVIGRDILKDTRFIVDFTSGIIRVHFRTSP